MVYLEDGLFLIQAPYGTAIDVPKEQYFEQQLLKYEYKRVPNNNNQTYKIFIHAPMAKDASSSIVNPADQIKLTLIDINNPK
jgi:hypothetical protein